MTNKIIVNVYAESLVSLENGIKRKEEEIEVFIEKHLILEVGEQIIIEEDSRKEEEDQEDFIGRKDFYRKYLNENNKGQGLSNLSILEEETLVIINNEINFTELIDNIDFSNIKFLGNNLNLDWEIRRVSTDSESLEELEELEELGEEEMFLKQDLIISFNFYELGKLDNWEILLYGNYFILRYLLKDSVGEEIILLDSLNKNDKMYNGGEYCDLFFVSRSPYLVSSNTYEKCFVFSMFKFSSYRRRTKGGFWVIFV